MSVVVGAGSIDLAEFVSRARSEAARGRPLRVVAGDVHVDIDGRVADTLVEVLRAAAEGARLEVTEIQRDLTTGQAADLLGVSRPTVVAMIDRGDLAATRVGTHRRVAAADVLRLRRASRSTASRSLDELAALSQDLGLYDE